MITRRSLGRVIALAPIAIAVPVLASEPQPYFVMAYYHGQNPALYWTGLSRDGSWSHDPADAEPFTTDDDAMRSASTNGLLQPAADDEGGAPFAVLQPGMKINRVG
jgi:hypothetical protein